MIRLIKNVEVGERIVKVIVEMSQVGVQLKVGDKVVEEYDGLTECLYENETYLAGFLPQGDFRDDAD